LRGAFFGFFRHAAMRLIHFTLIIKRGETLTMVNLLLLCTVWLSRISVADCWSGRSVVWRQQLPLTTDSLHISIGTASGRWYPGVTPRRPSSFLCAQNDKDKDTGSDELRVLYNDDAFGLVFLSSIFIAKDYTFAACFAAVSFVAVILVQFGGVKFNPLFPGLVAVVSFIVSSIAGNVVAAVVPEEVAIPVELGACAVSLVWGLIQATKDSEYS